MCAKFNITLFLYWCLAFKSVLSGLHQLQCDCGRANERSSKIVGGVEVPAHKYPWMVTVYADNAICGGALLTRQYVLTAAHCVNIRYTSVGIAVHDKDRPGQKIQASMVKIHPKYRYSCYYDIALIKLRNAVIISEQVRTLCLPHNLYLEQPGKHAITAGWGMTQPENSKSESQFLKEVNQKILYSDWMITAEGANQTGSCMSDSGSPLFTKYANGRYHVLGVTSTTRPNPRPCMGVTNFVRVSVHNQWIMENIMDSMPCNQMASVATNHL